MSKSILVIDDHLLFADSLKFLLDSTASGMEAQVFPALEPALAFLNGPGAADLILLDYSLPQSDGMASLDRIRIEYPNVPVAFLTGLDDPLLAIEALERGAIGWLTKSMSGEALIGALRLMLAGERFVPASLLLPDQSSLLTPREREVATLLAQGLADKQIAEQLGLETGTVKVHVKHVLRKFGAENRTKFALRYRGA